MHSVMQDYIPPAIGLPFAAILWIVLLVIWFKAPIMRKVNNFFAHRRHLRRMRRGKHLHPDEEAPRIIFDAKSKIYTTVTR